MSSLLTQPLQSNRKLYYSISQFASLNWQQYRTRLYPFAQHSPLLSQNCELITLRCLRFLSLAWLTCCHFPLLFTNSPQFVLGKSAQGTLNPIFLRAGGTLINQGTLMTRLSLRHKFLYRNSGFRTKIGELILLNWMVMESEIRRMNDNG